MNSFLSSLCDDVTATAESDYSAGKCFFHVELELLRLAELTKSKEYIAFQEDAEECKEVINDQVGTSYFAIDFKNFEISEKSRPRNVLQRADMRARKCMTFIAHVYPHIYGEMPVKDIIKIRQTLTSTADSILKLYQSIDFLIVSGNVSKVRQRSLNPRSVLIYVKSAVIMETDVHVFTAI